ncbi:MAG: DUF4468 domain-containing protein [Chitinophagaceae bacterium]|nr:DUF4468 domain-containing protein [Chitinophagaceae bacterium]
MKKKIVVSKVNKIILLLFFMLPFYAFSQKTVFQRNGKTLTIYDLPVDTLVYEIAYEKVVNLDSMTKEKIYLNCFEWVSKTYNSANSVIQMNDREAGVLVCKGVFLDCPFFPNKPDIKYTLTIKVKENKLKYRVDGFNVCIDKNCNSTQDIIDYIWSPFTFYSIKQKKEFPSKFNEYIELFIRNLINFTKGSNQSDDW